MNPENIYKIERLLEELKDTDTRQLPKKLPDFLNSVCDAVALPHDTLFDSTNGPREKKFISVCLLRLLCCNEAAILDTHLRVDAFTLFDDQIGSIYHRFEIDEGDQNYEKSPKLREVERQVLDSFDQITASIFDLGSTNKIRQSFMQALNSETNKLFLEQFVTPPLINRERIGEVFEKATAYNESSMVDRVTSYQDDVEPFFNKFLGEAVQNPSIFTEQCIFAPVKKIYELIQNDFERNDAIKPTTVAISPLDRKYPLHVIGQKVELKFRVENQGPGYAFDVEITIVVDEEKLNLYNPTVSLGILAPRQSSDIIFEIDVKDKIEGNSEVIGAISWLNFDESEQEKAFGARLPPQRTDLNWDELKKQEPYILEAINDAENLVGRAECIDELRRKLLANPIASSIIHGQKRVGKTSIAKVVQAEFEKKEDYTVIYVSIGAVDKTTSQRFVTSLGNRIVRLISRSSNLFRNIERPDFEGALEPLIAYFEDAIDISPEHKFIIILDEFDEIPRDLVRYDSTIGDTFFHNIRAISEFENVGFVFVGGENIQLIKQSTDRLNRAGSVQVDYFDKGKYWNDFRELVKRPVTDTIDFNKGAINTLYEMDGGKIRSIQSIYAAVYTPKLAVTETHTFLRIM